MAKRKRRPANDRALKKYKDNNMWIKNKIQKLEKHIKNYPNDEQAEARLGELERGGGIYNRNNVPKKHTHSPRDIWFSEIKGSIKGKVQHHLDFGANINKTPSRPDWVQILEKVRSKPLIRTKRRGHRRVKDKTVPTSS